MAWIELEASDGHVLAAWCAEPARPARGAIVVLQEIFGVNGHIRAVCDRYATQGWLAIAPALYDRVARSQEFGYAPEDVARGREIRAQVSDEQALIDVQAAIDLAGRGGRRVAVLGFCWGGTLAWHLDEVPRVPVLMHFGNSDAHIPPDHVARIAAAAPGMPLYRYEAGHGFNCDDRPAFHAASAELAGARTRAFLEQHIPC
jgi:carboxymethylenebutenolidase